MLAGGLSLFLFASLLLDGSAFIAPSGAAAAAVSRFSRITMAATSTSSVSKTGTGDNGEILEPQGDYHSWYSIQPLLEAAKWSGTPGTYL